MHLADDDLEDLVRAKRLLEATSLAARMVNILGVPIEIGFSRLPSSWFVRIQRISGKALQTAFKLAVLTINDDISGDSSDHLHRVCAVVSGCIGGAFGLPALAVELPVTTTIMLRSVADIARSEGENLNSIEARLACLEVFALGGKTRKAGGVQTGYYLIRSALTRSVSEVANYIVEKGMVDEAAPVVVRLIANIANRFGLVVSEKAAATSIPIIGAVSGGIINNIFMDHFQKLARGHFIIRRLERNYGVVCVMKEYERV
ncbi:MAG: EcsC family protein [Deltaproteobacteria bacterium]|nr:EcsC family protein [Deltaproteobacteria bacterium]